MSVSLYLEIVKPGYNKLIAKEDETDDDLRLWFNHVAPWQYAIAVAGGYKTYNPPTISNDPEVLGYAYATSGLECALPVTNSLNNYRIAIEACKRAIELHAPGLTAWLKDDLRQLEEAQAWFKEISLKMPEGIARLDWLESAWHLSAESLAHESLSPSDVLSHFTGLNTDCDSVELGYLSKESFAKKYKHHADSFNSTRKDLGDIGV